MKCEEVHRHLGLYLDSELSNDLSFLIAEHIQSCPSCLERFHSEQKIEKHLRSVLCQDGPEDLQIWDNALAKVTGIRPKLRKHWFGYIAAAACLLLALGLGTWFTTFRHHEMDLASSVAQCHLEYLGNRLGPAIETRDIQRLERFFSERMEFPTSFVRDFPSGYILTGGKTCFLDKVPAVFWMVRKGNVALSIFSFARDQLLVFPDATKLAAAKDGRFHCKVGDFEFFTLVDQKRVISAVGEVSGEELETLLLHLAGL